MAKKDRQRNLERIADLTTEALALSMASAALSYVTSDDVLWTSFKAYVERINGGTTVPDHHQMVCHVSGHLMMAMSDERGRNAARLSGVTLDQFKEQDFGSDEFREALQRLAERF